MKPLGEFDGLYFWPSDGKLQREYREPAEVRARNRERLAAIGRTSVTGKRTLRSITRKACT